MFFIFPIENMNYGLSWQYSLILLAGVLLLFSAKPFTNIWMKVFWIIILIQLIFLEKISVPLVLSAKTINILTQSLFDRSLKIFLLILVSCFFVSWYQEIEEQKKLFFIRISALLLCSYILIQKLGYYELKTRGLIVCLGNFNPTTAGIYLALCFPAFLRKKWWTCLFFIGFGLYEANSLTAYIVVLLSLFIFFYSIKEISYLHILAIILFLSFGLFLYNNNYIAIFQKEIQNNTRWSVWNIGLQASGDQLFGRGLGSWKILFPYFTDDHRLWWSNAHNEYIQGFFEYGIQFVVFFVLFLCSFIYHFFKGHLNNYTAIGMITIFVTCFAYPVIRIVPLALLCFIWLGMYFQEIEERKIKKTLCCNKKSYG